MSTTYHVRMVDGVEFLMQVEVGTDKPIRVNFTPTSHTWSDLPLSWAGSGGDIYNLAAAVAADADFDNFDVAEVIERDAKGARPAIAKARYVPGVKNNVEPIDSDDVSRAAVASLLKTARGADIPVNLIKFEINKRAQRIAQIAMEIQQLQKELK